MRRMGGCSDSKLESQKLGLESAQDPVFDTTAPGHTFNDREAQNPWLAAPRRPTVKERLEQ